MIDAEETRISETDTRFCDLAAALHRVATDWLKVEGWQPPSLDFYAPPEGVRRTVWAATCYAVLCASADSFAAGAGTQAKMAAKVLWGLRGTADALAHPGADRAAIRAGAVGMASAAAVLLGERGSDVLAEKLSGLASGPRAKAEIADVTWRKPLGQFMRRFFDADPLRRRLDGKAIWEAFTEAEPWREEQARKNGRGWPSEATAARTVNKLRDDLTAE